MRLYKGLSFVTSSEYGIGAVGTCWVIDKGLFGSSVGDDGASSTIVVRFWIINEKKR